MATFQAPDVHAFCIFNKLTETVANRSAARSLCIFYDGGIEIFALKNVLGTCRVNVRFSAAETPLFLFSFF